MDNMLSVYSRKANKQPKTTKKKPVKIVYISNPMKVHTSAAEFRALVQQLTGQHANYPDITTTVGSTGTSFDKAYQYDKKGFYFAESPELSQPSSDDQQVVVQGHSSTTTQVVLPNYGVNNNEGTMTDNSDLSFEDYVAEDYVPELLENLPSNLWYD